MKIEETKSGTTLVMSVEGRLDAASAPSFQDQLLARIAGGQASVLLDLSLVDFISSAGLRAVLIAAKRLREGDGQFAVCALHDNVREVFRVSGFESIIDIHPDRHTALERLS
jgi:anti-anti-sigma factor